MDFMHHLGVEDPGVKLAGTVRRTLRPAETMARIRPHMRAMGITRVADITGLDTIGIPVATACRPNARSLSVSQGKGATREAAATSALMEAVEFYHAEHVQQPLLLESHRALSARSGAVDPRRLPLLPGPSFSPRERLLWIEGVDLVSGGVRWVPYEMVHIDYTMGSLPGGRHFARGSNGLASGNHVLEAVSHALLELIERDAAALWAQLDEDEQQGRRLDLDRVSDRFSRELLEAFTKAGVAVAAWDLTSDVGVPVVLVHATEREPNPFRPVPAAGGLGCHPSGDVALQRALTEAAQSRLIMISGQRDDVLMNEYRRTTDTDAEAAHRRALVSAGLGQPLRRGTFHPTYRDEVAWILDQLDGAGFGEAVLVDLSRDEIRVPVVRLIVPGMAGAGALEGRLDARPEPVGLNEGADA